MPLHGFLLGKEIDCFLYGRLASTVSCVSIVFECVRIVLECRIYFTGYSLLFSSRSLKSQQNLTIFPVDICSSYNFEALRITESMILMQKLYSMFSRTLYFFVSSESSSERTKFSSKKIGCPKAAIVNLHLFAANRRLMETLHPRIIWMYNHTRSLARCRVQFGTKSPENQNNVS